MAGEEVGRRVGEEVASDRKAKWARAGWREARAEAGWVGDKHERWRRLCMHLHVYAGIFLHFIRTQVILCAKYQLWGSEVSLVSSSIQQVRQPECEKRQRDLWLCRDLFL